MLPTRWEPFDLFSHDSFARMFDDMVRRFAINPVDDDRGTVRVVERDDAYEVELATPGYGPEHLQIWVDGDTLRIEGERAGDERRASRSTLRKSVTLPRGFIDRDKVEATVEHGVVTVRLPKPEQLRPRRIEVKAGASLARRPGEAGLPGSLGVTSAERPRLEGGVDAKPAS